MGLMIIWFSWRKELRKMVYSLLKNLCLRMELFIKVCPLKLLTSFKYSGYLKEGMR
jgi:hypothetical protein